MRTILACWGLLALVATASVAGGGDAVPVVQLHDTVRVTASEVRWIDLSATPLPSDLGRRVVLHAPAPGGERTWSQAQILREAVRAGHAVVPRLRGSPTVTVRRSGGEVPPDRLTARIRALLDDRPLPAGAVDDRFEILRVPTLRVAGGGVELHLDGEVPRVGRGAVPLRVVFPDGDTRRIYAMVARSLRVAALRTTRAVDVQTPLTGAHATVDTLWTDELGLVDRLLPVDTNDGRWSLVRSVRGGHLLRDADVRATPVVRRGESVRWIVERDGLRVEVRARARNDGAVGDWISVQGPFDDRQYRVVVVAPGRVADHPPVVTADAPHPSKGRP